MFTKNKRETGEIPSGVSTDYNGKRIYVKQLNCNKLVKLETACPEMKQPPKKSIEALKAIAAKKREQLEEA